jgi:hypothetical protein
MSNSRMKISIWPLSVAVIALATNAGGFGIGPIQIGGKVGEAGDKAVAVATAPARAAIGVGDDVLHGKVPSIDKVVVASNPALAQVIEAGDQTGVSETARNLARLPKKANETLDSGKRAADNANQGITEVRQFFPGFKAAVDSLRADASATRQNIGGFLGMIALPAQALLWAVTILVAAKIYRFLGPKRAT